MGRKFVVLREDGAEVVLEGVLAPDEQHLHDRFRRSALNLRPGATQARAKSVVAATFPPPAVVSQEVELPAFITDTVASINDRGNLA
jgi:hypothetical protein